MDKLVEQIEKKLNEAPKKLIDDVYKCLWACTDYKMLSMDRQGEIAVKVAEMIRKKA